MSQLSLKARAIAMLTAAGSGEGVVSYMYLDTVSKVTIGYGFMMPSAASTSQVIMVDARGYPASDAQKQAEWNRLRALSADGAKINFTAGHFRKDAQLFITDPEALRLLDVKLDEFLTALRLHYPGFDKFPDDAQLAMVDMEYNLGGKLWTVFKHFTKAVNNPKGTDWAHVARLSHRVGISAERNRAVRDLFLSAERALMAPGAPAPLVPTP